MPVSSLVFSNPTRGKLEESEGRDPARVSQEKHPSFFADPNTGTGQYPVDSSLLLSSGKVEAVKVHHLIPRSHKVLHERLLRVVTCIDFRECSELGVGAED